MTVKRFLKNMGSVPVHFGSVFHIDVTLSLLFFNGRTGKTLKSLYFTNSFYNLKCIPWLSSMGKMLMWGFSNKDFCQQSLCLFLHIEVVSVYSTKVYIITKTYSCEQNIYNIHLNLCRRLPRGWFDLFILFFKFNLWPYLEKRVTSEWVSRGNELVHKDKSNNAC